MKSLFKKLSVLMVALILAMCVAACGGNTTESGVREQSESETAAPVESDTQSPETVAETESAMAETTEETAAAEETSDSSASLGLFESVEDFIASDMMQEQIATLNESLASSGLTIDIQGEGNTLYYIYTIQDEETAAAMDSATLESYLQSQESTLADVADSVKSVVSVDSVTVVVQFLAPDGSELITQEFTF